MAALQLAGKLAILNEALKRLEGELERDENWRALHADLPADASADRAHRDMRLRQALEANPVYRAWKDVREAAALLGSAPGVGQAAPATPDRLAPDAACQDGAAAAAAAPETPPAAPGSLADALQKIHGAHEPGAAEPPAGADAAASGDDYELPPEIANLIATHFEQQADGLSGDPDAAEVGERATQAVERALLIPTVAAVDRTEIENARRRGLEFQRPPTLRDRVAAAIPEPPERAEAVPASGGDDAIGHSVPLEAEDLAFLLRPARTPPPTAASPVPDIARVAEPSAPGAPVPDTESAPPPTQAPPAADAHPTIRPLRDRLLAEAQAIPSRSSILAAGAAQPPATEQPAAATSAGNEPQALQRLSRLIKAWSRR